MDDQGIEAAVNEGQARRVRRDNVAEFLGIA
jgi:hypothetical protein